jgi:tetratricopeptide (TPR) repeat protein
MNDAMRLRAGHVIIIAAFVLLAFLPGLGAQFVNWDDQSHLVENKPVQSFDLHGIFTQTVQKIYIPLTMLSFAVEHRFFGNNPFVYHLDNLLLHLINTLLVYWFVQRLGVGQGAAFWAALLFGVHPMRVESVSWITERKDLLYAFFYLLALGRYQDHLTTKRMSPYVWTMVFGVLSLLAKPMALSLPLVLFLMDWLAGRKLDRRAVVEKIPFFLYVIPITWITYTLHVRNPIEDLWQAPLIWMWTFNFYLWKFVWPYPLVPVYHLPPALHPVYFLSAIFFIGFVSLTIRYRSHRWWSFAVGYYFLSIFFLLRFDVGKDINIVADRFMYLPSLGFCILFGMAAQKIIEHKIFRFAPLLLWTIISVLSFRSIVQTRVWNDTITLWTYVIRYNPTEFLAYNDRAVGYITRGFYELGIRDYTSILQFDPDNADAFFNRGLAYEKVRNYQAAVNDFTKVIQRYPYYEKAYLHRGTAYEAMGRLQDALDNYNRTIAVSPAFSDGYMNRGNIFNRQGKLNLALEDYNRAIELSPRFERAYNNRGIVYAKLSDDKRALEDLNTAIAIDPEYAEVYYNRSVIYQRLGKKREALADALRAKKLGVSVPEDYLQGLQ